jgi:membrane-associated phospholipid phosphatase
VSSAVVIGALVAILCGLAVVLAARRNGPRVTHIETRRQRRTDARRP